MTGMWVGMGVKDAARDTGGRFASVNTNDGPDQDPWTPGHQSERGPKDRPKKRNPRKTNAARPPAGKILPPPAQPPQGIQAVYGSSTARNPRKAPTMQTKANADLQDVLDNLEHKTAVIVAPDGGILESDEKRGEITAIVSVTGIKDQVGDIIVPGAYKRTLQSKQRPKVILGHDWSPSSWAGKILDIKELMPGDRGLPKETAAGDPWPTDAGAVIAEIKFNMNATSGREAFGWMEFFGTAESAFSIGYNVPRGGATVDQKSATRYIKDLDLFECSLVLHGAAPLAGLLGTKEFDPDAYLVEDTPEVVVEPEVKALEMVELTAEDLAEQAALRAAVLT